MKVLATPMPGLVLLELESVGDARGRFMEVYRRERYAELGITAELVQDNFSSSVRDAVRGLHYQLVHPQGKLVHVTRGEIWDVVVDLRRGAPTFGTSYGVALSADNRRQLWIPPGFAHGYVATSESADVHYKVTAVYSPAHERAVRWNDPALAIRWPLAGEPRLSPRDAAAPLFADAELP